VLDGVVPFPPEFARRYREEAIGAIFRRREFAPVFSATQSASPSSTATHTSPTPKSTVSRPPRPESARLGTASLDRVVVSCRTSSSSSTSISRPENRLHPHRGACHARFLEVSQFANLSGAAAALLPTAIGDFDFTDIGPAACGRKRHRSGWESCRRGAAGSSLRGPDLREPKKTAGDLRASDRSTTRDFPALGGTTGVPKLIPRTHKRLSLQLRIAAKVCGVTGDSVLSLPAHRAQSAARLSGTAGDHAARRKGGAFGEHQAEDLFD